MPLRITLKAFCLLATAFFTFSSNATNYYISNDGNDANIGNNALMPWRTLNKLNSFTNLKPGDSVLFKKGDSFYGSIAINNSGTAGNPIVFSAYGIGEKPIITGFTTVNTWTYLGANIWESTTAVSSLSTCNMVVVNGVNTPMGRYPNNGYLTFQSHNGNTSITSNNLTNTPNWAGAEIVVRSQYALDKSIISSQNQGTLNFSALITTPTDGFGFFIQNSVRTLDLQNEWYYNSTTKKIRIYSKSSPSDVQVASHDMIITIQGNHVVFDGLSLEGSNYYAFFNEWAGYGDYTTIKDCKISFSGIDAVRFSSVSFLKMINNLISNSNNNGIHLFYNVANAMISGNEIYNSGVLPGMGQNGDIDHYSGIVSKDPGAIINNNKIVNTGYCAITCLGDSFTVKNNYIDSFCIVLQDGGGIYTGNVKTVSTIFNNIVLNGIGASQGTDQETYLPANGIYLDDNSSNIEVYNNTVSNCANAGLFLHNNINNINIHDNTLYSNRYQLAIQTDVGHPSLTSSSFKNNIYVSKTKSQLAGYFTSNNSPSLWGILDSNYYARPIDDNLVFSITVDNYVSFQSYDLAGWKTYLPFDPNSKKSPKVITSINDLRFEYNSSTVSKKITLDANYMDVTGQLYPGSITLAPFTSAILIKSSELGTLPLSWLGVQAQWINESEAKVSWQVSNQQNVKEYRVQYSRDGQNFINGCSVISSTVTSYNCIITAPKNIKNYFRVIQTDIDGKITYSKTVLLQPSRTCAISVYPNPAKDKLYIQGVDNFSNATIIDAGGKIINQSSTYANIKYIDISKLIKGIYFIKLESVYAIEPIKFIKE